MKNLKELLKLIEHPFFLYDLDFLNNHLSQIKTDSPEFLKIWFACKANPHKFILELIKSHGLGIDVASQGEFDQAKYVGFSGNEIITTGPAKSKEYLAELISNNVNTIILESKNQALWANEEAKKQNKKINVLLRFQLDWSQLKDQESVLGGSAITPFGLSPEDWNSFSFKHLEKLNILGTHIFQWGNMLNPDDFKNIWNICIAESLKLSEFHKFNLKVVDLGGGLGLDYVGNQRIDYSAICKILSDLKIKWNLPEVWMELGRYAVGECGSYFTQIIDIKTVRGKNLVIVEGGINQLARPALTGESFPCEAITQYQSSEYKPYQIHGPLCTALDKLGEFNLPDSLQIGDWLKFKLCGAYGFTESMPFFLGHSLPGEVILKNKSYKISRYPESARSYLKL